MTQFIVRRLLQMIPTILIVSVAVFSLLHISGVDPILLILGPEVPAEVIEQTRIEYGLDQPLPVQYLAWLQKAVTGDLGRSLRTQQPVLELIVQRLPVTVELAVLAYAWAMAIAVPLGIVAAMRRNGPLDAIASATAVSGVAIPNFWLGVLLILLFSLTLRWLPPSGFVPLFQDPLQNLKLMILPAFTVGVAIAAVLTRMVRSSMLETLGQDYIRTARSKGLPNRTIVVRHALRNALIPVVTIAGLQVGRLMGGAVITEQIFAMPGVGRLIVESIFARDYPVVQGAVLMLTVVVLVTNLVVDLVYAKIDPRITYR